ncbi:hypothetical protein EQG66_02840 [Sphingobium fluviale]|uniref:Uncharacterized protein n=1 Tax=Sphingobium fluviale TaxID=2506423 RepID=A0A4Q1KLB2_9SPHN|nr:hypothetical protein EQG66_02840 [Sphingobium fluviale]
MRAYAGNHCDPRRCGQRCARGRP